MESGNIKLGQVASDALGVSGKLMLRALAEGERDAEKMSEMARRTLKRRKGGVEASFRRATDFGAEVGAKRTTRSVRASGSSNKESGRKD